MQAATDIFLGWQRITGLDGQTRDYYVGQLHDWKGSADPEVMAVRGALHYSRLRGATLARTRGGEIESRSLRISAKARRSIARSPTSQPRMPTRTSVTMRHSSAL
jgi:hypothetical protein